METIHKISDLPKVITGLALLESLLASISYQITKVRMLVVIIKEIIQAG